ncbi:MAG: lipoyl(octanoyl) transferase [Candidatus Tokpelaia sp. JSC085]|nr:MAG: lipoyl(octanoyl) transferase [Candidatus Tokpelaia sp. JSC085]
MTIMEKNPNTLSRDKLACTFLATGDAPPVEWRVEPGLTPYPIAIAFMEKRIKNIRENVADELIWLVEHPPLYTAGISAEAKDLLIPTHLPVYYTKRGGKFTYHGPGQRIAYVMLDLKRRKQDIRSFVAALEEWSIRTLAHFSITGERREDRVGIWIRRPQQSKVDNSRSTEDKIVAIGIRLWKWVTYHGIAINVHPSLEHYSGIIPCGITEHGVTSLVHLGLTATMEDVDTALGIAFHEVFGACRSEFSNHTLQM